MWKIYESRSRIQMKSSEKVKTERKKEREIMDDKEEGKRKKKKNNGGKGEEGFKRKHAGGE